MRHLKIVIVAFALVGLMVSLVPPVWADIDISFTTLSDAPGTYIKNFGPEIQYAYLTGAGTTDYRRDGIYILFVVPNGGVLTNEGSKFHLLKAADRSDVPIYNSAIDTLQLGFKRQGDVPLDPNTEYLLVFSNVADMSPDNSHNAPYWNPNTSQFEVPFTTSGDGKLTVSSTTIGDQTAAGTGSLSNVNPVNAVLSVLCAFQLDASTVNATNVQLYEGTGTGGPQVAGVTIAVGSDSKSIKLTPPGNLKYGLTYTIHIVTGANGIKSYWGSTID